MAVHGRWGQGLHWSIYQAGWATDVVFKSSRILPALYEELVRTAAIEVKCRDIYGFWGRRLSAKSVSQVSNRLQTLKITDSVKDDKPRSYRGVNFFQSDDLSFMPAILRREYQIAGFTNRALQANLTRWSSQ